MNRFQRREGKSAATGFLEVGEVSLEDESRNGNGGLPMQERTPPRPAWGWLYAVFPLTILLFALVDLVPETSGWRILTETIAVLVVFGTLAAWVRSNRSALALSQEGTEAPSDADPPRRRTL